MPCFPLKLLKFRKDFLKERENVLAKIIQEGGMCETSRRFKRCAEQYMREAEAYRAIAYQAHMKYFIPKFKSSSSCSQRFLMVDWAEIAFEGELKQDEAQHPGKETPKEGG